MSDYQGDNFSPVSWRDITDKPGSFPPWRHKHLWQDLYGRPNEFPPSAHKHHLDDLVGFGTWQRPIARLEFTNAQGLDCRRIAGAGWVPQAEPGRGQLVFAEPLEWMPQILVNLPDVTVTVAALSDDRRTLDLAFACQGDSGSTAVLSLLIF